MGNISETTPHIDEIGKNLKSVDPIQLEKALKVLESADLIILAAEGRSKSALYIAIKGLPDKEITALEYVNFPWEDIKEAAQALDKNEKYTHIVLLVTSGSGGTVTPSVLVDELYEYIEKTGTEKFTIISFGSFPGSHIGKKIQKTKGIYVKLKGADRKPKNRGERLKYGNMNDAFELESLLLVQKIKQAINNSKGVDWIIQEIDQEINALEKIAKKYLASDFHKNLIKATRGQGRVVLGGRGPAKEVVKMTEIRMQHIKEMMSGRVFLSGSSAMSPKYDDILIVVSCSGENKSVIQWMKDYSEYDCRIFSITSDSKSTIAKKSESFVVPEEPDEFYMQTAVLLSLSTIKLAVHLADKGFYVPDDFMKKFHSRTE